MPSETCARALMVVAAVIGFARLMRLRLIMGIAAVGGIAVFGGVESFDDETTRDEAGEITEAGGLGAFVIRVGDCVQLPDEALVASVEGVPCDTPHDAQAYATVTLEMPEFDAAKVNELALDRCLDRWHEAVGTVFEEDLRFDISSLVPTEESWDMGDREAICFIISIDGSRLHGSHPR